MFRPKPREELMFKWCLRHNDLWRNRPFNTFILSFSARNNIRNVFIRFSFVIKKRFRLENRSNKFVITFFYHLSLRIVIYGNVGLTFVYIKMLWIKWVDDCFTNLFRLTIGAIQVVFVHTSRIILEVAITIQSWSNSTKTTSKYYFEYFRLLCAHCVNDFIGY